MADYGLLIKNTGGGIQIDSTYKNYVVLAAGSGGLTVGWQKSVDITDTNKVPIVAVRPSSTEFACLYGFGKSGSDFITAKLASGANAHTIYWKEFVEGLSNSLPAYGLVIYNSSGDVVFHSDDTPMIILGVDTGSYSYTPGSFVMEYDDVTVNDADNNYFLLHPVLPIYIESWSVSDVPPMYETAFYTRGIKKINSTTIRVGMFQFLGSSGSGTPPAPSDGWINDYILIEV